MNAQKLAKRAYGQSAETTRTPRSIEYHLLAGVSHRMKAAAQGGSMSYPRLVEALSDNHKIWTAFAVDVADKENKFPSELRARIFYLAEFVQIHTGKILNKKAGVGPLLEINSAILRGLMDKEAKR